MMWDEFLNRWHFRGVMTTKTAIRVGTGSETCDPVVTDLPIIRDERGIAYVPGSSVKGAVRCRLEQLVRTLEVFPGNSEDSSNNPSWNGLGACNPLDHMRCCVSKSVIQQLKADNPNGWPYKAYKRSCRICRIFGSQWIAGKFSIKDLYPVSDISVRSELRDGISIDRDKGTVDNKYDFEVVAPGSTFAFEAVGENLDYETHEPGLLLLALEELSAGIVRIGGFKSRGLGVVGLDDFTVAIVDAPQKGNPQSIRAYLDYISGKMPEPLTDEVIDKLVSGALEHLVDSNEKGGANHA